MEKVDDIFCKLKQQTTKAYPHHVINIGEIINENTVPRKLIQIEKKSK